MYKWKIRSALIFLQQCGNSSIWFSRKRRGRRQFLLPNHSYLNNENKARSNFWERIQGGGYSSPTATSRTGIWQLRITTLSCSSHYFPMFLKGPKVVFPKLREPGPPRKYQKERGAIISDNHSLVQFKPLLKLPKGSQDVFPKLREPGSTRK